mgnify:FL=1
MRVLILTVTAGQGHNQVAKTLCEYLQSEGAEALYLDALEYINPVLKESVSYGYLMSAEKLPKVYGKVYRLAEKRDLEGKDSKFIKISNTILSGKLVRLVGEYMPDVIVCTHVFAAILMNYLSDKIDKKIKTVGVITDFTIHPYWEDTTADYYITANEMLTNQARKRGIDVEKIVPIGIPINPKFAKRTDKQTAREKLGIADMRTVLVMSGSMGYGKVAALMEKLDKSNIEFQIISVCGRNEKLKNEIDGMQFSRPVYNYGSSDKIDLFMDAADCIVTKPGGLTTSEALAKGLPMIMANPIPGQEDRNVEFLLNNGAAMKVSSTFPIDEAIYQMFNNAERRKTIGETVAFLGKPNAMRDCVKFIMEVSRG